MTGQLPQPIGDDLVLRRAAPPDHDRLVELMRVVFEDEGAVEMEQMLSGQNPHVRIEDVLVVVDRDERIVSSLCLIPTQWELGQTTLRLGQVEFVATRSEYRGRGLIRAQFAVMHRWMAERQFAVGYIWGIPYFYRLFDYHYAIDVSPVGALTVADHAARVRVPEGVVVRPIADADVPALLALDRQSVARADIRYFMPERGFRWLASGRPAWYQTEAWIALRGDVPIGSAMFYRKPGEELLFSFTGERAAAEAFIATALAHPGVEKVVIDEVADSPVGRLVAALDPKRAAPEALYLRVYDPLGAFQTLAGEFERRVAASQFAGLSRDVDLGLYRFGIRLGFERGRLVRVESLPGDQDPKIGIPPDVLPKLLFGYRGIDEIAALYPDLRAPDDWELLRILFPPLSACIRWFV